MINDLGHRLTMIIQQKNLYHIWQRFLVVQFIIFLTETQQDCF